jgi:hypothetical protein
MRQRAFGEKRFQEDNRRGGRGAEDSKNQGEFSADRIALVIGGDLAAGSGRASPKRVMSAPAARTHTAVEKISDFGHP